MPFSRTETLLPINHWFPPFWSWLSCEEWQPENHNFLLTFQNRLAGHGLGTTMIPEAQHKVPSIVSIFLTHEKLTLKTYNIGSKQFAAKTDVN